MAELNSAPQDGGFSPSRLQVELAGRILALQKERGAEAGAHLVEQDLCREFDVSRTPIRGALKFLESKGLVASRANRGFVLLDPHGELQESGQQSAAAEEDDKLLFVRIAQARNAGALPDACSQQLLVRMFGARLGSVKRVLGELAELGVVERKPGNGWSFTPSIDSAAAQNESYRVRMVIEPAVLLEPTFVLDAGWAAETRERHEQFRKRPWRESLAVDFFHMNADFHEQLARCSGNRYMLGIMQQQNRLRTFLNYQWDYGYGRVLASISEHLEILDQLERGRNSVAAEIMRQHLVTSRDETGSNIETYTGPTKLGRNNGKKET